MEYILNTLPILLFPHNPRPRINQTESITRYGGGIISEYKMDAAQSSAKIQIQVSKRCNLLSWLCLMQISSGRLIHEWRWRNECLCDDCGERKEIKKLKSILMTESTVTKQWRRLKFSLISRYWRINYF